MVGKAAYVPENLPVSFGAFCKVVRTQTVDSCYLGQYFQSPRYRREISEVSAGVNINNIRNEHIDELTIPAHLKSEQMEIVQILTCVDKQIECTNQQLTKLDELVKSRFVEMFGTIHDNKFGYVIKTLQDVCEQIKDGTHQTPTYTDDCVNGYKFLSSKDVTTGKIDWTHLKYIPEELHNELYARIASKKGDILLAKNGTTGIAAIVDRDEIFDIYVSLALPCLGLPK